MPASTSGWAARLALRELSRAHVAIGVCLFLLGFLAQGALASWFPGGAAPLSGSVQASTSWDDLVHILLNNSGFFLVVSLLPGLNSIVVGPTLFILGTAAHQIHLLPWTAQFDLLYRHTAFELVALFLAARISYIGYFAVREFVGSGSSDKTDLVARLKGVLPLYGVMFLCTLVGAILEGNVYVHV